MTRLEVDLGTIGRVAVEGDDAWRELTAGEAETVERLAAQRADGRFHVTEMNPA